MPGAPQLPCLPTRGESPGLLRVPWASHSMAVTAQDWWKRAPEGRSRAAWLLQPLPRLGTVSLLSCSIGQVHGGGEIDSPPNGGHPGPMALSIGSRGIVVPSIESVLCDNTCAELPGCRTQGQRHCSRPPCIFSATL